jgi:hypothetical protein
MPSSFSLKIISGFARLWAGRSDGPNHPLLVVSELEDHLAFGNPLV